jgi:membrane-anchored glycerophosphoryl diester phosphodiesterase (GDPDase)
MKQSGFRELTENLKVSFKLTFKNMISFILAILGILIVTLVLLVILIGIAAVLLIVLFNDYRGIEGIFILIEETSSDIVGLEVFPFILFVVMPVLAPFLMAFGALFGMGRELIESGGTSSEGVLIWYKAKFLSLAIGGLFYFSIIFLPLMSVYTVGYVYYNGADPGGFVIGIFVASAFVWIVLSGGVFIQIFPAIIDGHSVSNAIQLAWKITKKNFDRVFSVWISFVLILFALLYPLILAPQLGYLINYMTTYTVFTILLILFVVIPALVLAISRVYLLLIDVEFPEQEEELSGVRMVGGV